MSEQLTTYKASNPAHVSALMFGDLSKLSETEKLNYYNAVCESLSLNPLTKPFEFLTLNGKLVLYATKNCAEQLRENHGISLEITERSKQDDLYVVSVRATNKRGRTDESLAAVDLKNLYGEKLANAIMKTETKAKRRVTLSICGLGMMDETEAEQFIQPQNEYVHDANFDYASEESINEIVGLITNADISRPQREALMAQCRLTIERKTKTKLNGQTITAIHIDDVEHIIEALKLVQPNTTIEREYERLQYLTSHVLFNKLDARGQTHAKKILAEIGTGEINITLKDLQKMNDKIEERFSELHENLINEQH